MAPNKEVWHETSEVYRGVDISQLTPCSKAGHEELRIGLFKTV
jgi:hypothetical protein